MHYRHRVKPFAHQKENFEHSRDFEYYALFGEQGTGKTKILIDTAAWQWMHDRINSLVVLAPNGVHIAWVLDELPMHMPELVPYRAAAWSSTMTRAEQDAQDALWDPEFEGLRVLTMNIEALSARGGKGYEYAKRFLNATRPMLVADESHWFKTPGAMRTKKLMLLKRLAKYRRIASGTPLTRAPLDAYTQMNFLHSDILGYTNYYSFRAHFAELEKGYNGKTGKEFKKVVGYRNLDELQEKIAPHSVRILKSECLDLPDKVYERRYVELGKKQRQYYNQMRDELRVELAQRELTVQLALTKILRLQQILGGYLPAAEMGPPIEIEDNKRLDVLMDIVEMCQDNVIVWARFRPELAAIALRLRREYGADAVVEYHGGIGKEERKRAIKRFQSKQARFFVANQQSGGTGLTLHAADAVIYYSNDFNLAARLQSEDRAHRIGQHRSVTYYDLEARGTVDTKIVEALRSKKELAELILQDPPTNWI